MNAPYDVRPILSALAYFDVFDYPLTLLEVYQYRFQREVLTASDNMSLPDVEAALNILISAQKIQYKEGFYFLTGRERVASLRLKKYKIAYEKYKIAKWVAGWLSRFPFIRLLAVCNTLAYSNAEDRSDIDFFIIAHSRRIWTSRFLCVLALAVFGMRPKPENKSDKICLSFWVSRDNLNLLPIAKDPYDIYLYYWIARLAPLYDAGGVYEEFLKANQWVRGYIPDFLPYQPIDQRRLDRSSWAKRFCEWALNGMAGEMIERLLKAVQLRRMNDKIKAQSRLNNKDVVVTDQMLKFHVGDRREEFRRAFEERLKSII
ncbi:MAG: hypothetical protein HY602_00565 [Parcubacteria group bacterium]|nr:hypothetical protein [Parcubacteria group bacterium]